MCGRYTLATPAPQLAAQFQLPAVPELAPRWNIAPTNDVAVVRAGGDGIRQLALLRWGLVPSWAKDPSIGSRMINARAETAPASPAFKRAFAQRRCLVLADGFYEWQKAGSAKQPFYFRLEDDAAFAFAGLWERWHGAENQVLETCTLLTTVPNELVSAIHNRMPVILDPASYQQWLDPKLQALPDLQALLQPFPAAEMMAYPVAPLVNSPRHDEPDCIAPLSGG